MNFIEINIQQLQLNPFTKIGKEWMLITAGNQEKFNTMTASWGGMGFVWQKNTITTYIRPQRYTKEFVDANDLFTISFLDEKYKEALNVCGTISGRDADKMKMAGLTPYFVDGTTAINEASLVMICKIMFHTTMLPEYYDEKENIIKWFPEKDYNDIYISEIMKVLIKQ